MVKALLKNESLFRKEIAGMIQKQDLENPYLAPEATAFPSDPSNLMAVLRRALIFSPISLFTAIMGGLLNQNPWLIPMAPDLHPMATPGLSFGLGSLLLRSVAFQNCRTRLLPLMPPLHAIAFGLSAILMEKAQARQSAGGTTAQFMIELSLASLTGMAIIAALLCLARMISASDVMRFSVVCGLLGTLCVAAVNTINILTPATRLFGAMFTWQLVMLHYLAWLNVSHSKSVDVLARAPA